MMDQEQLRLEVAQDMLDSANSDPEFLNIMSTDDESWVYGYDPETKAQSSFSQKITMRRAIPIHSHSHDGCTRLTLSAGG
jgi:flagellar biosynthesis/type III secretory pathway chaperone